LKDYEKLISPGDSLAINVTGNSIAVNRLSVELDADNMPQALRSTVIGAELR